MNPTVRRAAARLATVSVPIAAMVALAAAPAQAQLVVPPTPSLVAPGITLQILEIDRVGFHVCAFTSTPLSATSSMTITGARSDGSVINLGASHTGTSWTTGNCLDVTENLTPSGEWQVLVTVSATAANREGAAAGGGTWDFAGEQSWDTA